MDVDFITVAFKYRKRVIWFVNLLPITNQTILEIWVSMRGAPTNYYNYGKSIFFHLTISTIGINKNRRSH